MKMGGKVDQPSAVGRRRSVPSPGTGVRPGAGNAVGHPSKVVDHAAAGRGVVVGSQRHRTDQILDNNPRVCAEFGGFFCLLL